MATDLFMVAFLFGREVSKNPGGRLSQQRTTSSLVAASSESSPLSTASAHLGLGLVARRRSRLLLRRLPLLKVTVRFLGSSFESVHLRPAYGAPLDGVYL